MDVTIDTAHISTILQNKDTKSCKKATLLKMQFKKWENITKANKWR